MREYIAYRKGLNSVCRNIYSFWNDPVGDMFSYLCESRTWLEKIIVIAHNAKAFDFHFILNRAILLKWQVGLIMNGMKIMSMREEHLVLLMSVSSLQLPLRKLPTRSGERSPSHGSCIISIRVRITTM